MHPQAVTRTFAHVATPGDNRVDRPMNAVLILMMHDVVHVQVAILESLQGQHGIVPLLEYGVMVDYTDSSSATQPQWVLVFPRYSGSLREWRLRRGQGLGHQDIELYLNIFLQVTCNSMVLNVTLAKAAGRC